MSAASAAGHHLDVLDVLPSGQAVKSEHDPALTTL